MTEYLVELYVPRTNCTAATAGAERFRRAAAEEAQRESRVRLLRPIYIPEDETCFLLVEADDAASVGAVARRADLRYERIVETAIDRFGLTNP